MGVNQAMPKPGAQNVAPYARSEFVRMLDERERKGVETYGTTLQTFNGRDAIRDLKEELIDAFQYACQIELELQTLSFKMEASVGGQMSKLREEGS